MRDRGQARRHRLRAPRRAGAGRGARTTRSRRALWALGAITCVIVGVVVGTRHAERNVETINAVTTETTALPADFQRGVNLTAYESDAYGSERARSTLERLANLGVTHVALVPMLYMSSANANTVSADQERTASDASLLSIMQRARELGISIALKPHVDVHDGTFRGEIAPTDPAAWFESYRAHLAHYAELAQQGGAQTLVVGTELTSMRVHEEEVRELVAVSRARFGGWLTWAANQIDDAEAIGFWDALDVIGIDAYMPLVTTTDDPDPTELTAAWETYAGRVRALAKRWERPVLFTELGYQSRVGATTAGGVSLPNSTPIDETEQANAYEAAFRAVGEIPGFRGIWWWDYAADSREDEAGDFTPAGKPAERVLAEWYGGRLP